MSVTKNRCDNTPHFADHLAIRVCATSTGRHRRRARWPEQAEAAGLDFSVSDSDSDSNEPKRYYVNDWPAERVDECSLVVNETCRVHAELVGRATLRRIEGEAVQAMTWACANYDPERAEFMVFASAVARTATRRVRERIGDRRLRLEKQDQDFRDLAVVDEAAIADYILHVRRSVFRWIAWRRKKPLAIIEESAKHDNEVAEVVLRVLELLRGPHPVIAFMEYERVGRPALWQVRDQVLGRLRRRERMWVVNTPDGPLHGEIPRPDHALLRKEIRRQLAAPVYEFLRAHLTPALCHYLDALVIELQLDDAVGASRIASRSASAEVNRASPKRSRRFANSRVRTTSTTCCSSPRDRILKMTTCCSSPRDRILKMT